jgi:hypothetical protein
MIRPVIISRVRIHSEISPNILISASTNYFFDELKKKGVGVYQYLHNHPAGHKHFRLVSMDDLDLIGHRLFEDNGKEYVIVSFKVQIHIGEIPKGWQGLFNTSGGYKAYNEIKAAKEYEGRYWYCVPVEDYLILLKDGGHTEYIGWKSIVGLDRIKGAEPAAAGVKCVRCGEFFEYATRIGNFKCWGCRNGW